MGRKRKQPNREIKFVALFWDMLNGAAYKALPQSAAKALPYFLGKIKGRLDDPQRYMMDFTFSYPEAKRYGFAPGTFSRIIETLITFGFIDPIDKGGLRGYRKGYNIFRLSRRWEKYGTIDYEGISWRHFLPKTSAKVTPKMEMNNSKNGNKRANSGKSISNIGVVEGYLQ